MSRDAAAERAKSLGVTIEARYSVGEYEILILSAKESSGLETWLKTNGYRIPAGASAVLAGYIKQGMRFFVAKGTEGTGAVGFSLLDRSGRLRSPKFMLPFASGWSTRMARRSFVYALTRKGRVEGGGYRPSSSLRYGRAPVRQREGFAGSTGPCSPNPPERVQPSFECAWDANWCDPCAAALSRRAARPRSFLARGRRFHQAALPQSF